MNYGEYMRRKDRERGRVIGYQMAQDASQVTFKNKALATTVTLSSLLASNASFTGVPFTVQTSDANACVRVAGGTRNVDTTQNILGYAQMAAVSQNIAPAVTVLPCTTLISNVANAPSTKTCGVSPGIIFTNPTELIADQGRQAAYRTKYNLPSKLEGLRGPVANAY